MDYFPINLPSKEHLTLRLSKSAGQLLATIVEVAKHSDTPVVSVTSRAPGVNTYQFQVFSDDETYGKTIENLHGVPKDELILFKFVTPLPNHSVYVTPLAFERAGYDAANEVSKFFQRTTPVQYLIAIGSVMVIVLLALLGTLFGILANLQQLASQ